MNRQTDKYEVLQQSINLMDKHLKVDSNIQRNGSVVDANSSLDTLKKAYKTVETSLIDYIRTKINTVSSIGDLTSLFADSCYAFAGTEIRFGRIKLKLQGAPVNPKTAFRDAITTDGLYDGMSLANVERYADLGFSCEPCDTSTQLSPYSAFSLAAEAYDDDMAYAPDGYDIALMPLLLHWYETSSKNNLDADGSKFMAGCLGAITCGNFNEHPLVGYYRMTGSQWMRTNEYVFEINVDFVRMFATKLTGMYNVSPESPDYYKISSIKRYIHRHLCNIYFNGSTAKTYSGLTHILDAEQRGETLTREIVNQVTLPEKSVVVMTCDMQDTHYTVNRTGLMSYVRTLEALDLCTLPDARAIADTIKQYCM